jgi:hypothetical protein
MQIEALRPYIIRQIAWKKRRQIAGKLTSERVIFSESFR